jgi:hypothetical protein
MGFTRRITTHIKDRRMAPYKNHVFLCAVAYDRTPLDRQQQSFPSKRVPRAAGDQGIAAPEPTAALYPASRPSPKDVYR